MRSDLCVHLDPDEALLQFIIAFCFEGDRIILFLKFPFFLQSLIQLFFVSLNIIFVLPDVFCQTHMRILQGLVQSVSGRCHFDQRNTLFGRSQFCLFQLRLQKFDLFLKSQSALCIFGKLGVRNFHFIRHSYAPH